MSTEGFKNITLGEIQEWQEKVKEIKTIGEFKELGRQLRDKYNLTDMEAINILNNKIGIDK